MARAPRFHVAERLRPGSTVQLPDDAAHHAANVLRIRLGEDVTLFDGHGGEYAARVASIQKKGLFLEVLQHHAIERESPLQTVLVQGISSGERMGFTIRKAVELGVAEIQPVLTAASVSRPKGERAASRQAHWQRIAVSACEQCGRNTVPAVREISDVPGGPFPADAVRLLLSPGASSSLSQAPAGKSYVIAAGPEAGFTAQEESALLEAGFQPVGLGPRILRTETAALAALAALNALRGDF